MPKEKKQIMKELLAKDADISRLPQAGDLIESEIIKISSSALIVQIEPVGTGIVYGGELKENRDLIKDLKVGDKISALVVDPENDDGYVELSIKDAYAEKNWTTLQTQKQLNEPISAKVIEANRGGLVIRAAGITGFLPVSQLSNENYPRVEGGDKNKILAHLNQFIGKELLVKIIGLDRKEDKLIVSEKEIQQQKTAENLAKYKKDDIVTGTITGTTDFGAFVQFDQGLEGLIHISELDWGIVSHPSEMFKEGQEIQAKIIDIQNGQVSLSIKALQEDPWKGIADIYQAGQTIQGKVIKINPSGVFVQIKDKIHGLAHASEFAKQNVRPEEAVKIGQMYDFEIISVSPEAHKMSLTFKV